MKRKLFFVAVVLMPMMAFSSQDNVRQYSGRVGKMVLDAMKAAGVKKTSCKDGACVYSISKFYSSDEGDGCGGGTTRYEVEFLYSDNTKYHFRYCDGDVSDGGDNPSQAKKNKAKKLETILGELDYYEQEGWELFAKIEKIECSTYDKQPDSALCVVTTPEAKK